MSREGMAELWISRIDDYRASRETVVAWCKRQQVSPKQFYYWMRKLKTADRQTPSTVGPKWVALSVGESTRAEVPAIAVRVGTVTVEVRAGFEPSVFADVVRTLKTLC